MKLVAAVFAASDHDELTSVEWKSSLDLLSAEGRFSVAKPILGMANRMPDGAESSFEGLGYVVIGVTSGAAPGVMPVDPAQLDDGLSAYLGDSKGPKWNPTYLTFQGVQVLVIVVEAPGWGDPIFTLRKNYANNNAGGVFVRKAGKTAPATPEDIELLQERLQRSKTSSPLELDVDFVGDVPISWIDVTTIDSSVEAWVDERTSRMVLAAEDFEARARIASDPSMMGTARFTSLLAGFDPFKQEEDRTLDEFISQVDSWADKVREAIKGGAGLLAPYFDLGYGIVKLRARNRTETNFSEVQVSAYLPGEDAVGFDEIPYPPSLPRPPRAYGEPKRLDVGFSIPNYPVADVGAFDVPFRRTWVGEGSVPITWDLGDLRPRATEESDDVYVVVRAGCREIQGSWNATSKSVDGVVTGEVALTVKEGPIDIASVIDQAWENRF